MRINPPEGISSPSSKSPVNDARRTPSKKQDVDGTAAPRSSVEVNLSQEGAQLAAYLQELRRMSATRTDRVEHARNRLLTSSNPVSNAEIADAILQFARRT